MRTLEAMRAGSLQPSALQAETTQQVKLFALLTKLVQTAHLVEASHLPRLVPATPHRSQERLSAQLGSGPLSPRSLAAAGAVARSGAPAARAPGLHAIHGLTLASGSDPFMKPVAPAARPAQPNKPAGPVAPAAAPLAAAAGKGKAPAQRRPSAKAVAAAAGAAAGAAAKGKGSRSKKTVKAEASSSGSVGSVGVAAGSAPLPAQGGLGLASAPQRQLPPHQLQQQGAYSQAGQRLANLGMGGMQHALAQLGSPGPVGLPVNVLLEVIKQHPTLKSRIHEIVSRKDVSENEKMAQIQRIVAEANGQGGPPQPQ